MLGDAIPAESFAAGRNETGGVAGNYNYQNENGTPNGWPGNRDGWFHSDLKDVAFWYTYKLFEKIVKGLIGVKFLYYLNPKSLDRNLEWDMKNNLCPTADELGMRQP